jgi:hypothetical protein
VVLEGNDGFGYRVVRGLCIFGTSGNDSVLRSKRSRTLKVRFHFDAAGICLNYNSITLPCRSLDARRSSKLFQVHLRMGRKPVDINFVQYGFSRRKATDPNQ